MLYESIYAKVNLRRFGDSATEAPILCATVSLANSMCVKSEIGPDRQPELDMASLPSAAILELEANVDQLMEQIPDLVEQSWNVESPQT